MRRLRETLGADLRSIAAFRIGIASLLLVDLIQRSFDLRAFYSDEGVLPRAALIDEVVGRWQVSLHLLNGTVVIQSVLFLVAGGFAVCLLVGYRTRLAAIVSWILLLSLHVRNPLIINAGDTLLRSFLFWGMFLPLGERASLDRRLGRTGSSRRIHLSVATAALMLQVLLLYVTTGIFKARIEAWQSGTAIATSLSKDDMVTALGRELLRFPDALEVLTHLTLVFEIAVPLLLLLPLGRVPLRLAVIGMFWGFHLALHLCFQIGLFSFVAMAGWVIFVPGEVWDRLRWSDWGSDERGLAPELPHWPRLARGSLAGVALLLVVWSNLDSLYPELRMPRPLRRVGSVFKLHQSWSMFADVHESHGWYVFPGRLANGETRDLWTGALRVDYDKPDLVSETFPNFRWRKLLRRLRKNENEDLRDYLGRYLWRTWQRSHPEDEQLEQLRVYYLRYRPDEERPDRTGSITVFGETHTTRQRLRVLRMFGKRASSG